MAFNTKGVVHSLKMEKLKQEAMQFYQQNGVPKELEKLLNEMAYAKPEDVFGYMCEYLRKLARPPTISGLQVEESYDSSFSSSISVVLHCTVNGVNKPLCSCDIPVHQCEDLQGSLSDNGMAANAMKGLVLPNLEALLMSLKGLSLSSHHQEVDRLISDVSRQESLSKGVQLAVSCVIAMATAKLAGIKLVKYLKNVFCPKVSFLSLPFLVVPLICGGGGKLRICDVSVSPLPGVSYPQQIGYLKTYMESFRALLQEKYGCASQAVTSSGHYVVMDKMDQPVELLQEAAKRCDLEVGKHLGIVIDMGGDRLYNQEKLKYEFVSGQLKTGEELLNVYTDLVNNTPGIIGVINPFKLEHKELWIKLTKEIGSKCFVISTSSDCSTSFTSEEVPADTEKPNAFFNCRCAAVGGTITDFFNDCQQVPSSHLAVDLMLQIPNETTPDLLKTVADLAIVGSCRFLRTHYLSDLMTSVLITHLLQQRSYLAKENIYNVPSAHSYTKLAEDSGERPPM